MSSLHYTSIRRRAARAIQATTPPKNERTNLDSSSEWSEMGIFPPHQPQPVGLVPTVSCAHADSSSSQAPHSKAS